MTGFDIVLLSILGLILGLVLVWAVWSLICNELTYLDRKKMLDGCVLDDPDIWEKLERLQRVSYEEHFRARFWLRDPQRLYD